MPVFPLSEALFAKALQLMPGGVNSPVRAWQAVGGTPFLVARGEGSRLYDLDGNSFLDYVCSWGPLILGHACPEVVRAIQAGLCPGHQLRGPHPGRGGIGGTVMRGRAVPRDGAPGDLRHRGLHERPATGPGGYRPRPGGQV